ncbi:MAG: sel1 repeat family protein, partial [Arcobacter sp.]|nr:sel1 repeat family protein [Arcobacter sp.]
MIKRVVKVVLIGIISLSFTACENNSQSLKKKEIKYSASLPMPEWDKKAKSTVDGYTSNWQDAKKDPIPATQIGYAYSEELKDYDKAIQWYKYSNSMKPMAQTSNYMCYAYQMKKEYEEAIKWCKNAIELGSDEALMNLATLYMDLEKYKEAIKLYENPRLKEDKVAITNLAYLYEEEFQDYKKAEELYLKATKKRHYNAYQGLSYLYYSELKDNLKSSAYAIALIGNKYSKNSVLKILQETRKIPNKTIKKAYE